MSLIDDMEREALVRLDRWAWIGARMAKRLSELYGQETVPHHTLCEMVYHECARDWEALTDASNA